MNKTLTVLIILLWANFAYSISTISIEGGKGFYTSDKFRKYNLTAEGNDVGVSLAMLKVNMEMGVYLNMLQGEATINHDNVANDLALDTTNFGFFANFIDGRLMYGFGVGRATIKSKITSSLSQAQVDIIKSLYGLPDVSSEQEFKFSITYSLVRFSSSSFYVKGERFSLGSSEVYTLKFGLKMKI